MTAPTTAGDLTLARLETLHAYKRLLGRNPQMLLTPFSEHQTITYQTDVTGIDVPEIHDEQRRLLEHAIEGVRLTQATRIVLLAGAPGMGKSHLLNYFRHPDVARRLNYLLVSPTNHWDIGDFEERLLDSLLAALVSPSPTGPHPLQARIEAIAFTALAQLLGQPGSLRICQPATRGLLHRLWVRLRGAQHRQLSALVRQRDPEVFRQLDFPRFSAYVCDRFLAEPGNLLHRHVLRVLLHYLFAEDRELVLHWLRGRTTKGYFAARLGVEEEMDRTYKRMDAVRLLMSLFSPEVTRGLNEAGAGSLLPCVFFLAFDQTEGRQELFDSEDDWFTFFAHLSELYNSLPNVLILFTMTLGLRDKLHAKLEKQFQDRIRRDERFVLRYVEPGEMLALYRRRLARWVGQGDEKLPEAASLGELQYVPFDQSEVATLGQRPVRDALRWLDEEFRLRVIDTVIDVPYDYLLWMRDLRQKLTGEVYPDTEKHLATVDHLLAHLGETFAAGYGIQLSPPEWTKTEDGLEVLRLEFTLPSNPSMWYRVFLVRLAFFYIPKIPGCLGLLKGLQLKRYFLWLVRPRPIDEELLQPRADQTTFTLLESETEATFAAMIKVAEHREKYEPKLWEEGERFLLDEFRKTYLGALFTKAHDALFSLTKPEAAAPLAEEAPQA